jgi:hypothetical protein
LLDAAWGFAVAVVASAVAVTILVEVAGHDRTDDLTMAQQALLQVPLWIGLLGAPLWATRRGGGYPVDELGLRTRWRDVPSGLAIGVATQLVLVPLLYLPILELTNTTTDELSAPARELTDRATDPLGVLLLVVIVGVGAPVVEEIFYRGLVQRSLRRRLPAAGSVVVTALLFGGSHFQLLQLPALVMFGIVAGYLAERHGRLGPAIWAHVGFNLVTVVVLLGSN